MDDPVHRLLRSATLELLEELDPYELADYEERVGPADDLAERIIARAADVHRSGAGADGVPPADDADVRALVAAALTVGGKGHGVHRNGRHARAAYEELRAPARHLSTAVLVRARRYKVLRHMGGVLAVREALLDGRPAPLADRPETTALAAAVAMALPHDPVAAGRLAACALDGAVALQASYEAAGAHRPEPRIRGARTDLLGDIAALVLPAAALEVCLEALIARPQEAAPQGQDARAAMEARVRELHGHLRTCLTSTPGPMAQQADADWLAWYDRCAARLASVCGLPRPAGGGDIVDVVACLHPWTRVDRTTTNRGRTFPVDFQTTGAGLIDGDLPRQATHGHPRLSGAHEDVLDFDALVRTTVGHLLKPTDAPAPPATLVRDWLADDRRADCFSGAEMWSLVLALRSLVHRLAGPEPRSDERSSSPPSAVLASVLHVRARERGVGPEEAVRQPHHALAVLLPPLWSVRDTALRSVTAYLRATGVSQKDAVLVSAALVHGPSQLVLAAAGPPTRELPHDSPLLIRPDRPWAEPGLVENHTTLGERLLTTPEAARKRLSRYDGPGAELIRPAAAR